MFDELVFTFWLILGNFVEVFVGLVLFIFAVVIQTLVLAVIGGVLLAVAFRIRRLYRKLKGELKC